MNQQQKNDSQPKKDRTAPLKIQFEKGVYAFKRGWLGNPYDPETIQGKEWQRGFNSAYFDNLK
jgi:hypothetical protein